ncbi:MAG: hypothetical protein J6V80_05560 [Clostridia bacterium]|nr:hypothetical protein [Clostridia bacterium]
MIYRDAASDGMRVFGLCALAAMLVFFTWLLLFRMCIFDYAVFKEDGIELHSPFKLKAFYKYDEVIGCLGVYTSVTEAKKYLTFTSKKHNFVVTEVDTSKRGNIALVNKLKVVYVPASDDIIEFVQQKSDLQWYRYD